MPTLLLKLGGNKYVNHTMFRPHLYIYDDYIIYKKRSKFVKLEEITVSYNHIVQVYLHQGIVFATIEIMNSGADNVKVKGVWKKTAKKAKKIIDKKIHHVHHIPTETFGLKSTVVAKMEKSIARLNELLESGRISQREYNKKRSELLKQM